MTNRRHLSLLKHDVKAWNYWRQENSDLKLDLSGANLSKLNLSGVNLSGANLRGVNLSGTNLKCAYLKGSNFYQACLTKANLSGSDLSEVDLTEADLSKADISSANLKNANLTKAKALLTNFQNSILTGACLEDWHIDSNTNLQALVCDYFYGKQGKQQRYPQNELQNFAPGECTQFIIDYFNQINAIVVANNNKPNQNSQEKVHEDKNIIDEVETDEEVMRERGSQDWEETSRHEPSPKSRQRSQEEDAISELGSDTLAIHDEETSPHAFSISDPRFAVQQPSTFDHIDNNWDEEQEKINPDSASLIISPATLSQKKNSVVRFSVALLFGLIVTGIAMRQIFKRAPIANNNLINCDSTLLKQAEDAIFIRDEEGLKQVIQELDEFDSPLGNLVDEQCKQTLYEVKYIYAIQIKAMRDNNLLEAAKLLCQLPEQYYQQKEHKPWFLRWSNSFAHTDFPQQLSEYIKANNCPAATYLNQLSSTD